MDARKLLGAEYSAAVFCKITGMDQRIWTNQIQAGNIRVDRRAETSGDKNIMTGYTGIRALIFASLAETMRYKQAGRIAWAREPKNEKAMEVMIEKAIDRIGTDEDVVCFEIDPVSWKATPILNRFQALENHNSSFMLAVKINITACVKAVLECIQALQ